MKNHNRSLLGWPAMGITSCMVAALISPVSEVLRARRGEWFGCRRLNRRKSFAECDFMTMTGPNRSS
ncbi:MAG TPA: hypothetical protein VNE82_15530 [Candidatus Binataceae bacterium]|nr:hypothetical protein [Candidatus Binataceae bacterium]